MDTDRIRPLRHGISSVLVQATEREEDSAKAAKPPRRRVDELFLDERAIDRRREGSSLAIGTEP